MVYLDSPQAWRSGWALHPGHTWTSRAASHLQSHPTHPENTGQPRNLKAVALSLLRRKEKLEISTHIDRKILRRAVNAARGWELFGKVFECHMGDSYWVRQRDYQETLGSSECPTLPGIQLRLQHTHMSLESDLCLCASVRVICYLYNSPRAFWMIPQRNAE